MKNKRAPARVCSRIGLALFAMMLVWYLTANGATVAAQVLAPALLENAWFIWAANDVPLYLLGMPVFLLILAGLPDGPEAPRYRPPLGPWRFALIVIFCLGGGYLLNLAASLILLILQAIFPGAAGTDSLQSLIFAGGPLPGLIFGVLVPAVGEEFLFRHMLWRKLRGSGDKIYIFFSALCFSLFHANFVQTPYTFVIGLALAWLYLLRGKLWHCMLAHFIINLLGIVVAPLLLEAEEVWLLLYGSLMLFVLIPVAVALFIMFRRRAMVAMQPPAEPDWPYVQTRPLWHTAWQPVGWPADPYAPPVAPEPPPYQLAQGAGWQAGGWPGPAHGGQGWQSAYAPPAYGAPPYGYPYQNPAPYYGTQPPALQSSPPSYGQPYSMGSRGWHGPDAPAPYGAQPVWQPGYGGYPGTGAGPGNLPYGGPPGYGRGYPAQDYQSRAQAPYAAWHGGYANLSYNAAGYPAQGYPGYSMPPPGMAYGAYAASGPNYPGGYAAARPPKYQAARVCLKNVGMALYITLATIMMLTGLVMLFMPA